MVQRGIRTKTYNTLLVNYIRPLLCHRTQIPSLGGGGRNCELSMSCSRINAKIGRFTYEPRIRPLTNLSILQQAWTIITMSLFLHRKFISKTFKLSWKMSIDQIKIPRTFSLWKDRLIFWGWGMTFISQNVFQPEMCLKVHDCYSIT